MFWIDNAIEMYWLSNAFYKEQLKEQEPKSITSLFNTDNNKGGT